MLVTRQKVLRRFWYPVMPIAMLADGPQPFTLLGEQIVLFLDAAGRPVALADRCCHRTAQLSKGFVEAGNLVCGYHGWTYDASGRCVRIPQNTEASIPANAKVPSFRCDTRYGYAWVALDEPLLPIFDLAEDTDPSCRRIHQFYEVWRCSGLRLMENSFDMAHLSFVHKGTFGPKSHVPRELQIEATDDGLTMHYETPVTNPALARTVVGSDATETVRIMDGTWFMPFSPPAADPLPERPAPHHHHQRHADRRRVFDGGAVVLSQRHRGTGAGRRDHRLRPRGDRRGPHDPREHRPRRLHRHPPPRRVPHGHRQAGTDHAREAARAAARARRGGSPWAERAGSPLPEAGQ